MRALLRCACALVLLAASALQAQAVERIESYAIDVAVEADGSLEVTLEGYGCRWFSVLPTT